MIHKNSKNYQLKKHIELTHSKTGHHKTIIETSDTVYLVVTKVSFSTIKLWVEHINEIIKSNPTLPKTEPITKINWLILLKGYRREFKKNLLTKIGTI
jgi:hypothetical protein